MRKLISIAVAAVITMTAVCAAGAEEGTVKTMTVDEAVSYALEHSLTIAKCESDIAAKKYSMAQAKVTQNSLKKNRYLEVSTIDTSLMLKGYYYSAAKLSYEVAQRSMEDNKKSIEVQVKNAFYTYLYSKDSLSLAEQNADNANEKLAVAKKKLESGSVSELDYKNFELTALNAKIAVNSATRNMEINLITLKNTLNYPAEEELIPAGELSFEYGELMTAEEAIEKSRGESSYHNIVDSFELAKERWKISDGFYVSNQNDYSVEKYTYESAVSDFTSGVNNLDLGIRTMYNSLLTLKEQVECAEFALDIQKSNINAAYLKYEMGLMTASDYREAEQQFIKAQNDLQSMKLLYTTTKLKYDSLLLQG